MVKWGRFLQLAFSLAMFPVAGAAAQPPVLDLLAPIHSPRRYNELK